MCSSAGVLTVRRTAIPGAAGKVPARAVPVMPDIPQVRDIAVRQGIRSTMRVNATHVRKDITNTARVPVTAARMGTPIITMVNATRVRKGMTNTTRAPVTAARRGTLIIMMVNVTSVLQDITNTTRAAATAARQGTRITMTGNAIRSPLVLLQVLTPW